MEQPSDDSDREGDINVKLQKEEELRLIGQVREGLSLKRPRDEDNNRKDAIVMIEGYEGKKKVKTETGPSSAMVVFNQSMEIDKAEEAGLTMPPTSK